MLQPHGLTFCTETGMESDTQDAPMHGSLEIPRLQGRPLLSGCLLCMLPPVTSGKRMLMGQCYTDRTERELMGHRDQLYFWGR